MKIETLRRWLSPSQDNITYIVSNILADGKCLVCDTQPSPAQEVISKRISQGLCPICGSTHQESASISADSKVVKTTHLDKKRIQSLEKKVALATTQVSKLDTNLADVQKQLSEADTEFHRLEKKKMKVDKELVDILRSMPAEQSAIASAGDGLEELETIAEQDRLKLVDAEKRFEKVVKESVRNVQKLQETIAKSFSDYLNLFIKEEAKLLYQPVSAKIGQSSRGSYFKFPAFRLVMSGGAVAGQTMRSNPNQVSQSQAEFVDLAFRMALMSVVSNGMGASLVVDAPEASLDFLFARRAGKQLAAFALANDTNRVIITSYLPSQHLVNSFLESIKKSADRQQRVVDLIEIAASNAALEADRSKYELFLDEVIKNKVNDDRFS